MAAIDPDLFPAVARGRCWQDLPAGMRFATEARTVTETDLVSFVGLTGFTEPLFTDAGEAIRHGHPPRIVPATLTFSFAEGLVLQTHLLHRTGIALLALTISAKAPLVVGSTIRVLVEITESRVTSKGGRGLVTSENHVVTDDGTEVLTYTVTRLVKGAEK